MNVCICDNCKKEIPIAKKKNVIGLTVDVIDRGAVKCEQWNVSNLFKDFDLCRSCAELISVRLDNEFLKMRLNCGSVMNNV